MISLNESMEKGDASFLMNETVADVLSKKQMSLRRIVALSVIAGITEPIMSACLAYMDTMRRDKIPQNLVIVDVVEFV